MVLVVLFVILVFCFALFCSIAYKFCVTCILLWFAINTYFGACDLV